MVTNQNRIRFINIRKLFLLSGLITFLIYFLIHRHADLFETFIIATLLGSFIFAIGTTLTAFVLLPFKMTFSKELPSHDVKPEDAFTYRYNDWYNDFTNPASPVYQVVHHGAHQHD